MCNNRCSNVDARQYPNEAAAGAGEYLDPALAMRVRVIEYEIPGHDGGGELIALITTITDPAAASAQELAQAYCQRWEEETGNDQLKTCLHGPGKVLRPRARIWPARRSTATCSPTTPSQR